MKILVTGCCGYIGSRLIPHLLADKHYVVGWDTHWFGDGYLPKDNGHFTIVRGDYGTHYDMRGTDAIIHLAGMTSDKSCQIHPDLAEQSNVTAFAPFVERAKKSGVPRFIFTSSAAVYGTTGEPERETYDPQPETAYSIAKVKCERILRAEATDDFSPIILRPAGVCGFAPRMRFDLTVNAMVRDAHFSGEINVHGGNQIRPNLHIRDFIDCLRFMLDAPTAKVHNEIFNVVKHNCTVMEVAQMVKEIVGGEIKVTPRQDSRSYAITGFKLARLGYTPFWTVKDAIRELHIKLKSGAYRDAMTNPAYSNVYAQ